MGMYVQTFVVPRRTRDKVIFAANSYRNHFYSWFDKDERMWAVAGELFVKDYDSDRNVVVVKPETYLLRVNDYRHEVDGEAIRVLAEGGCEQPGWIYSDDMSNWLWLRYTAWPSYEIVLTEET